MCIACDSSYRHDFTDFYDTDPEPISDADLWQDSSDDPLLGCRPDDSFLTILNDQQPIRVHSFDSLVIGATIATIEIGSGSEAERSLWIFHTETLDVFSRTTFDHLDSFFAYTDLHTTTIFLIGTTNDRVIFEQYDIAPGWELESIRTKEICTGCIPINARHVTGMSRIALATSTHDQTSVQLHLIPLLSDDPVIPSEPIQGSAPRVAPSSFGPLMFFMREGSLYAAQYHWNGLISSDPQRVSTVTVQKIFGAQSAVGHSRIFSFVETDLGFSTVAIDARRNMEDQIFVDGLEPGDHLFSFVLDDSRLVLTTLGSNDHNQLTPHIAVVSSDPLELIQNPFELVGSELNGVTEVNEKSSNSIAVTKTQNQSQYRVVWTGQRAHNEYGLFSQTISCAD